MTVRAMISSTVTALTSLVLFVVVMVSSLKFEMWRHDPDRSLYTDGPASKIVIRFKIRIARDTLSYTIRQFTHCNVPHFLGR